MLRRANNKQDRQYEKSIMIMYINLRLFKVLHRHPVHDLSFVSALINRVAVASINQCIYMGARYTGVYSKRDVNSALRHVN